MKLRITAALPVVALLVAGSTFAKAEEVFRIQIGRSGQESSQADMQRRITDLERAVIQLQSRVFQLESTPPPASAPVISNWSCTIHAMGDIFSAAGPSKAVASTAAIDKCKAANSGNGFFCKDPKCEQ